MSFAYMQPTPVVVVCGANVLPPLRTHHVQQLQVAELAWKLLLLEDPGNGQESDPLRTPLVAHTGCLLVYSVPDV